MALLPMTQKSNGRRRWTFFRAGGFDQVRLAEGADILALDQLDQKLWVALSCPTQRLEFDQRTLGAIDEDGDGRIRAQEVIAAVKWAGARLNNPDDLTKGLSELPLTAINGDSSEGQVILRSAKEILSNLGKPEATAISLDDTAGTEAIFQQARFNGDGIVPPDVADDSETASVIENIVTCMGGETDRSGKAGVNREKTQAFFSEASAWLAWKRKAQENGDILFLGPETSTAATDFEAVRQKVDDFFARCRLAAYDERAAQVLNRQESDYAIFADHTLSPDTTEASGFPIARIAAGADLPLKTGVNPAWSVRLDTFVRSVVTPLLGEREVLTETEWASIGKRFAAFNTWQADKAGAIVEPLGLDRIETITAGTFEKTILDLIDKDESLREEFENMTAVDRLIRYVVHLHRFLNNFVAFSDFYTRKRKAVFQEGSLYLDGRCCELCVTVDDMNKHAALATLSRIYIAYCDCTRRGGSEKKTIAAAFTGGDSDFLMVGRNGVFYDCQGQDWDATIVKIIDHPISIRQAFWSPYKKIGKMVREQIMKRAAAREKKVSDQADTGIAKAAEKAETGKPAPAPPPAPFDVAKFAGIFAAIGLALGAIGTALTSVFTGFFKLAWWQMPLVIVAILLIISGPSMLLAWLKLRQRSLGPILDANGWAVNARAKINVAFGTTLTKIATLPEESTKLLEDPFADKKNPWPKLVLILAIVAILLYVLNVRGFLYDWTGGVVGSRPVATQSLTVPSPAPSGGK